MTDEFDLARFVNAQAPVFETALAEIRRGDKRGHWMWFIFPQLTRLGSSTMARTCAIRSFDEAQAFLGHPLLGLRLRQCVTALNEVSGTTAEHIFGKVDPVKLRSSLMLFIEAGAGPLFEDALERWFGGRRDETTLRLLAKPA